MSVSFCFPGIPRSRFGYDFLVRPVIVRKKEGVAMVSSDASDNAEYCGNSASAGKQASSAQETRRSVQAGAQVITDSDQRKKKRSLSSSSSKSLATSEGCSSSREIGCDSSQDEYYHDQITRSLEHDRASSGSPQSSKSLHMESCCSSAMGRAGSTGVVNIRNTDRKSVV